MMMLRLPLHLAPKFNKGTKQQQQQLTLPDCHADKLEPCLALVNATRTECWGLDGKKPPRKTLTKVKGQIPKQTKVKEPSRALEGKRVSFEDHVEINFTVARQEISTQEKGEIWYSRDEYDNITRICIEQINILENGNRLKDRKYCFRGLESSTRLQALSKRMNRCLAYEAVFCEQERQHRAGVVTYDVDEIARVYCSTSNSCQLWAHAEALVDQKEANAIHDESEEYSHRTYARSKIGMQ